MQRRSRDTSALPGNVVARFCGTRCRRLALPVFGLLTLSFSVFSQVPVDQRGTSSRLILRSGFDSYGASTPEWIATIRHRHAEASLDSVARLRRTLSTDAQSWEATIRSRMPLWSDLIDSFRVPFPQTTPPETVTVLLGHLGGNDAFVFAPSTICFDLERLVLEYGNGSTTQNADRIDRFFAHEFTHIIHKAWAKDHRPSLRTPLDRALWECLTEGLGHYRSLTAKWVDRDGSLTEHAKGVLHSLAPIFAERMYALDRATEVDVGPLLQGLSEGRFDRKWGALPVALWLAQETHRNDRELRRWVDAGPEGVLVLAMKYLPEELRKQLPTTGGK